MPTYWILVCKELGGGIYVTRLPKSVLNPDGSVQPGIPDNWYFVGPGTNPSVSEYSGTKFLLSFTYLSHLYCRVVDIATWPPTEVIPIQTPVPYPGGAWNISLPQDALTLKTEGDVGFGLTQQFFKPPLLQNPLLFLAPATNTYSVTIQPQASWSPDPPSGVTVYYRLYSRPYPYNGPWILSTDWTASAGSQPWFSLYFQNVGSMRFQFAVTWGTQFLATDQWNPNAHAEGIPGQAGSYITVDSTTEHSNAQESVFESLTYDLSSADTLWVFGSRVNFLYEAFSDSVAFGQRSGTGFSVPLVGGVSLLPIMGTRVGFVQIPAQADSVSFSARPGGGQPYAYQQGATLKAVMG